MRPAVEPAGAVIAELGPGSRGKQRGGRQRERVLGDVADREDAPIEGVERATDAVVDIVVGQAAEPELPSVDHPVLLARHEARRLIARRSVPDFLNVGRTQRKAPRKTGIVPDYLNGFSAGALRAGFAAHTATVAGGDRRGRRRAALGAETARVRHDAALEVNEADRHLAANDPVMRG